MHQQIVEANVPAGVDQAPLESPQAVLIAPQATPQLADRTSEPTPTAPALAPAAEVPNRMIRRSRSSGDLARAGHCVACHTANPAHLPHLWSGDCVGFPGRSYFTALTSAPAVPTPPLPHPTPRPTASKTGRSSTPGESQAAPQTNSRTPPPTLPQPPTTSDGKIPEDFRSIASAGGPDEAMIAALSAEIGLPKATGSPPRALQEPASMQGSQSQGQPMQYNQQRPARGGGPRQNQ